MYKVQKLGFSPGKHVKVKFLNFFGKKTDIIEIEGDKNETDK